MLNIITVFYDQGDTRADFEKTIDNLASQTETNFTWIAICKSIDLCYLKLIEKKTEMLIQKGVKVEIIKNSPEDVSLFSAMNIGLKRSINAHALFLNAGDELISDDSIDVISKSIRPQVSATFRVILYRSDASVGYIRPSMRFKEQLTVEPSHQGLVAWITDKTEMFDTNFSINADKYWIRRFCKKNVVIPHLEVICKFPLGGLSNSPSLGKVSLKYKQNSIFEALKELIKLVIFVLLKGRGYSVIYKFKYDRYGNWL